MPWHLKDRELEKKLISIDSDFIERLNRNCEIWDSNHDGDLFEFKQFTQKLIYKLKLLGDLVFSGNELEYIPEYNPHAWNDSRKVTPPENVVFRAKVYWTSFEGETIVDYDCLIYQYSSWYRVRNCKPFGGRLNITKGDHVEFRPWEDLNEGKTSKTKMQNL